MANSAFYSKFTTCMAGAMREDTKLDVSHWKDIERLAIFGESKWEEGMATFCKPFTSAKIQYFDHTELDEAKDWIEADRVLFH